MPFGPVPKAPAPQQPLKPSQYCTDALPALLAEQGISMGEAFGNAALIRFNQQRAAALAGKLPLAVLRGTITDASGTTRREPYVVCPLCEVNTLCDAASFHCWGCFGTFRMAAQSGRPCVYYTRQN